MLKFKISRASNITIEQAMKMQQLMLYSNMNIRSFINFTRYVLKVKENQEDKKTQPEYTVDPIKPNQNQTEIVIFTTDNKFKKLNCDENIWEICQFNLVTRLEKWNSINSLPMITKYLAWVDN